MKVTVEPYNSKWDMFFEQEKVAISNALKDLNVVIEHVGSTSITGLAAKPIIDILVGTASDVDLEATILPMQVAGFTYNKRYEPAMPYRRYFVRYRHPLHHTPPGLYDAKDIDPNEKGFNAITHVHTVFHNSEHWIRHIAFREYLKNHADVRAQYEQLKFALVQRNFEYKLQYSEAKSDFISEVEKKALKWWKEQQ